MRVTLTLTPSGGACRHVHVLSLGGQLLDTMTRDDFGLDDDANDPVVRRAVKQSVRRFLAANPGATVAQIRAAVEADTL